MKNFLSKFYIIFVLAFFLVACSNVFSATQKLAEDQPKAEKDLPEASHKTGDQPKIAEAKKAPLEELKFEGKVLDIKQSADSYRAQALAAEYGKEKADLFKISDILRKPNKTDNEMATLAKLVGFKGPVPEPTQPSTQKAEPVKPPAAEPPAGGVTGVMQKSISAIKSLTTAPVPSATKPASLEAPKTKVQQLQESLVASKPLEKTQAQIDVEEQLKNVTKEGTVKKTGEAVTEEIEANKPIEVKRQEAEAETARLAAEEAAKGKADTGAALKKPEEESYSKKHTTKFIIGGITALLAAIGGGGGGIGGFANHRNGKDSTSAGTGDGGTGGDSGGGTDGNSEYYQKNIHAVAGFFTDIDEKLKDAIENSSYYDTKFIITGPIKIGTTTQDAGFEYDFETGGAGPLGTPLQVMVQIIPEQIGGKFLTASDLINQISSSDAQKIASMLLNPSPEFIFALKLILLIITISKDTTKTQPQQIQTILEEINKLFSRLNLNSATQNISAYTILAALDPIIQDILNTKTTKIFTELVKSVDDPTECTKVVSKIYEMRKNTDFNTKIDFANNNIVAKFDKALYYSDWLIVMHMLVQLAAELGNNLSQSSNQKQELTQRCNGVIGLIEKATTAMKSDGFDDNEIAYLDNLKSYITKVKSGTIKVTPGLDKPLFGDYRPAVQDVSLTKFISVSYHQFKKDIESTKFEGDYGYVAHDFTYGKTGTRRALQAIFFKALKDLAKATESLFNSTELSVTLRSPDGTTFSINPAREAEKIIQQPSKDFENAKKALTTAIEDINTNPDSVESQHTYAQAKQDVYEKAQLLADAINKFRQTYAVYLPLKLYDETTRTVTEFLKKSTKKLKKQSKFVTEVFDEVYESFKKPLGFNPDLIYEKTAASAA